MDLGSAREDLWSSGTVTAAKTVFASSEQELTHLDSQLFLLLTLAAAPRAAVLFLTIPAAPEVTALLTTDGATPATEGPATALPLPSNAFTPILEEPATAVLLPSNVITPTLEGAATAGDGTGDWRREGCTGVGAVDTGRTVLRDDEPVMMSLHGSHLLACKNGRSAAGFNPDDMDGDADSEDTPRIPPVPEPIPEASTDSNPTASEAGGSSTGAFEPGGDTNSE